MFNINSNLPLWNRTSPNFETLLYAVENELYGSKQTTGYEIRHLWEQTCEAGRIFIGETSEGPLFIGQCHLPSGTFYFCQFMED